MNRLLLFLALVFTAAVAYSQSDTTYTLQHQSLTRSYLVHFPPGLTANAPVVFVLHGGGLGTSSQVQNHTRFDLIADTAGFITVYPQALNNNWADGRSNQSDDQGIDDVGFIDAIISHLGQSFGIDYQRVYSCGISNGGFMSQRLAVDLGNRIAAIGVVAATMSKPLSLRFPPAHQVPVLMMCGTSDLFVPYNGGNIVLTRGENIGAEDAAKLWAAHNGCDTTPVITPLPNTNRLDFCTIDLLEYGLCDNSTEVLLYRINRGGHTWPGTDGAKLGNTSQDINGCAELWKFFSRHQLSDGFLVTGMDKYNAGKKSMDIYPNPASGQTFISNTSSVRIFDALGREIFVEEILQSDGIILNISGIESGVYTVVSREHRARLVKN